MEHTPMAVKPKVTPKDFFLWAGAMIGLYVSVVSFLSLIFDYLNYAMPGALSYYASDPYAGGISYEMASLIVFFPLFLVLMRFIRNSITADATRAEIWVRSWALYITLFVAGLTIAGDLVTLVMYFFNGDVTLRFVLKVLVVFLVMGAAFLHFLADLRGYWQKHPRKARVVGWSVAGLMIASIIAGFFIVGTPWEARLYRFDEQKVSDLQQLQGEVVSYWQAKQELPATLSDVVDPIMGYTVPTDEQTGAPYEYAVTGKTTFELCATFNAKTQPYALPGRPVSVSVAPGYPIQAGEDSWYHDAGHVCFSRTIDPARYPPLTK
jgi:hypothetical protein